MCLIWNEIISLKRARISCIMLIFGLFAPATYLQAQSSANAVRWVDSVYTSLTLEQRIGQLIMARANQSG
ncbi:MAG TPA: hypothetical protein PKV88_08795, partial [Bacteroidales bacterium]|nr:hypothetical protein [Bacteroidales bacterium]